MLYSFISAHLVQRLFCLHIHTLFLSIHIQIIAVQHKHMHYIRMIGNPNRWKNLFRIGHQMLMKKKFCHPWSLLLPFVSCCCNRNGWIQYPKLDYVRFCAWASSFPSNKYCLTPDLAVTFFLIIDTDYWTTNIIFQNRTNSDAGHRWDFKLAFLAWDFCI